MSAASSWRKQQPGALFLEADANVLPQHVHGLTQLWRVHRHYPCWRYHYLELVEIHLLCGNCTHWCSTASCDLHYA